MSEFTKAIGQCTHNASVCIILCNVAYNWLLTDAAMSWINTALPPSVQLVVLTTCVQPDKRFTVPVRPTAFTLNPIVVYSEREREHLKKHVRSAIFTGKLFPCRPVVCLVLCGCRQAWQMNITASNASRNEGNKEAMDVCLS
jgi:hypothetical protein